MKKLLWGLIMLCFYSSCSHNTTLQEKFNEFKNEDYAVFNDLSITYRRNVYMVSYHDIVYAIRTNYITKNIDSIKKVHSGEMEITLSKKDITYIEDVIKKFETLGFMSISVDEFRNVFLSFSWDQKCTYYFLKLSSKNTLNDIKRTYYEAYENNWYFEKRCSE
ncbi:hypothetical protein FACS1894177_07450 [Bacteroidia bacterium]|nr:hypothetical protein FACS1894177_07450 [Bacteroidia bacterium]